MFGEKAPLMDKKFLFRPELGTRPDSEWNPISPAPSIGRPSDGVKDVHGGL